MNIRNIWGKVVLYLRENHLVALYVACGDLTDISLDGDKLVISVEDKTMFSLLSEGIKDIQRAINWQGLNMTAMVVQKNIPLSKQEEDIVKLKNMLGEKLEIIGKGG